MRVGTNEIEEKEEKGREKEKVKRGKKRESSENQLYIRGLNRMTQHS